MIKSIPGIFMLTVFLKMIYVQNVVSVVPNSASHRCSHVCEDVPSYPTDRINKILKSNIGRYEALLGTDVVEEKLEINNRNAFGGSVDEQALCESRVTISYPKIAQNKSGSWFYILNHDNFTQGVRVEVCSNPEAECLYSEIFPTGKKAKCEQKYSYRYLVAYADDDSGKLLKEAFKLPAYCQCTIYPKDSRSRFFTSNEGPAK